MEQLADTMAWIESNRGERTPVQGSCFFGRTPGNTVVVPSAMVSRRHALVNALTGSEYWLVDLGSRNGTYLNGRRLSQPSQLSDGDRIEIGGSTFQFRHPMVWSTETREMRNDKTSENIRTQTCWLLVADIESSTDLSQKLGGAESLRVIGHWLDACREVVDANGGTINKFLGDGIFAYWNGDEKSVELIVRTLTYFRALQNLHEVRFRLVLHQGTMFVGGAPTMGEESLLGNEVNFVFRMEKLAARLGLSRMMSEPASARLKTKLDVTSVGRETLAGLTGEFEFFSF
jgi:adenylate cyclase